MQIQYFTHEEDQFRFCWESAEVRLLQRYLVNETIMILASHREIVTGQIQGKNESRESKISFNPLHLQFDRINILRAAFGHRINRLKDLLEIWL